MPPRAAQPMAAHNLLLDLLISHLHGANKDQRHTVAWARRRPNPMQSIYAIMPPTQCNLRHHASDRVGSG